MLNIIHFTLAKQGIRMMTFEDSANSSENLEDKFHQDAIRQTGLTDFGDPYYKEGLGELIRSMEKEGIANPTGEVTMHYLIINALIQRLQFIEALKQSPELFQHSLIPPIIIIGLPRTGTTFLHRLLCLDPANRGVPLWELMNPLPVIGGPDLRRENIKSPVEPDEKSGSSMDHMHYFSVDDPEECIFLLLLTFVSALYSTIIPVRGYTKWMLSKEHIKAYQEYRSLLKVLQGAKPEHRLTLKAPFHTWNIKTLYTTIPEAIIIQTHRNPVEVCGSVCSVASAAWDGKIKPDYNLAWLGREQLQNLKAMVASILTFREKNPDVVHDIYYDQFVNDPKSTVKSIYNHFSLPWSSDFEERLETYIIENPKDKHGKHNYSLESFGLNKSIINDQFSDYNAMFGLAQ